MRGDVGMKKEEINNLQPNLASPSGPTASTPTAPTPTDLLRLPHSALHSATGVVEAL